MDTTVHRLGMGSAILAAAFSLIWFVTYTLRDAIAPVPSWEDMQAYADALTPARTLYIYPSLLLPIAFVLLLVCVHYVVAEERRVWTLTALSVGIVYAAMASINYTIQVAAVQKSLGAGQTAGLSMFVADNPHSMFAALANAYVYMAISMVFLAFAFEGSRLQRAIRWLLLAQIVTAVGQVAWSMFGLSTSVFIVTSLVWVVGAPAAFVLLAFFFRGRRHVTPRQGRRPAGVA